MKIADHVAHEQQALDLINQGRLDEAEAIYRTLINAGTINHIVYGNLAAIYTMQRRHQEIIVLLTKALELEPNFPEAHNNMGVVFKEQGNLEAAIEAYINALKLQPNYPDAYNNLANALKEKGNLDAAIEAYQQALQLEPNCPESYNNMGTALKEKGNLDAAIEAYKMALQFKPNYAEAYNNMGNAYKKKGNLVAAIAAYNTALKFKQNYPLARNNIGNAYMEQGELDAAIDTFQTAIRLNANDAEAHNNLGAAYKEKGELDAAINAFSTALNLKPNDPVAYSNIGIALKQSGDLCRAIDSYNTAIKLNPNYSEAHFNLGNALLEQSDVTSAIASYNKALDINSNYAEAHYNLGVALQMNRDLTASVASYKEALELEPNNNKFLSNYIMAKKKIASWGEMPSIERFGEEYLCDANNTFDPLIYIGHTQDQKLHLNNAMLFAKSFHKDQPDLEPGINMLSPQSFLKTKRQLRIGYFSSNFRDHAVLHLLKGVLRNHDEEKFEIYLFDTIGSRPKNDPYLHAIEASTLNYIYIGKESLDQSLEVVRNFHLNVAIDLMGYTDDKKVSKLFSKRVAPVQINYLGYPSTTGSKRLHDYIIADNVVIPQHHEKYFAENVVRLPDCYLCSDNANHIANLQILDHSEDPILEEADFVFCSFNNIWKITPKEFDIWMRLLHSNPGSCLWLRSDLDVVITNLKVQAKMRNIDPARLVFAKRADMDYHLARHQKADLFLDTFTYNAHATALNALWAGLPVLTMQGNSFPSRVGASILTAAGLPELITTSERDYTTKAQWLVDHPDELQQLKDRLKRNRLKCSLFNTVQTTQNLEQIYSECWEETIGITCK